MPVRLPTIASLTDAAELARVFGPVASVRAEPLAAATSFSGSRLERVILVTPDGRRRALVMKTVDLVHDWLAALSHDAGGREAAMLDEPALSRVGDAMKSSVLAYGIEPDGFALLMEDLGPDLLPDERAPLRAEQERALVAAIARLHALHWNDRALDTVSWLARPADLLDLLSPRRAADPANLSLIPEPMRNRVLEGWRIARATLHPRAMRLLDEPAAEYERRADELPKTFLHGDVKVGNFALRGDGAVVAFDWALAGHGTCALDLGWYLAVNASRITTTKERFVSTYRGALEAELRQSIDDETWRRIGDLAVLAGARMLLWSKAYALGAGTDAARAEWDWWAARLLAIDASIG